MTNQELTAQAMKGLTSNEADLFAHHICGAAEVWIDSARWQSIVASARQHSMKVRRQPTEEITSDIIHTTGVPE